MQTRLAALENEVQRLRALNEKISLSVGAGSPEGPGLVQPMPHSIERMSPPPENKAMSQLTSVTLNLFERTQAALKGGSDPRDPSG